MAVRGSLATMPVDDVFDWISRRFAAGSLTLERGPVTRVFHIDSGYVTSVGSNVPGERLGQLLMGRGLMQEQQLREAFAVQADTGVALGKILLMVGAVDEQALAVTLIRKAEEALADSFSWEEGTFAIAEAEPG